MSDVSLPLGLGKPPSDVRDPPPALGLFRVIGWRVDATNRYAAWVEGEFADRDAARACVDALMAAGAHAAGIEDHKRRRSYSRSVNGGSSEYPIAVTALVGLAHTGDHARSKRIKPKTGTYRRK